MKNLLFMLVLLCSTANLLFAQDQDCCPRVRIYGDAANNTPQRIKHFNGSTYVAGTTVSGGQTVATFTRLDANMDVVWEVRFSGQSIIYDFERTDNDRFLLVGRTLPIQADNRSILARVDNNGALDFMRIYDNNARETFTRIVRHPSPLNTNFPYYLVGYENGPGGVSNTDEVHIHNLDENGTFNWSRELAYATDDQWARGLLPTNDGHLVIFGDYFNNQAPTNRGVMVKVNGSNGTIVTARESLVRARYQEGVELNTGQIVVAGWLNSNGGVPMLTLFDADFTYRSTRVFNNSAIDEFRSLQRDNANNLFTTVMSPTGLPVICRASVVSNQIQINALRFFEDGETAFTIPFLDVDGNDLYYTDGRNNHPLAYGGRDVIVGNFSTALDDPCLRDTTFANRILDYQMRTINVRSSAITLPSPINNISLANPNLNMAPVCTVSTDTICNALVNPRLECIQTTGDYAFTFQVFNNSGFPANQVELLVTKPLGYSIPPISVSIPDGNTSAPITVNIPASALSGADGFCIRVKLSNSAGGIDLNCCTNPEEYCFEIPDCEVCECGRWSVNQSDIPGGKPGISPCGKTFTTLVGTSINVDLSYSCLGSDCDAEYVILYSGPTGSGSNTSSSAVINQTFTLPGVYSYTITPICGGMRCEPCTFKVRVIELKPVCECGNWDKIILNDPASMQEKLLECGQRLAAECGRTYQLKAGFNCSGNCDAVISYTLTGPSGITSGNATGILDIPLTFTQNGVYVLTIRSACGNSICGSCKITFIVRDCDAGCSCGSFEGMKLTADRQSYRVSCNGKAPTLDCFTGRLRLEGVFTCKGQCEDRPKIRWVLTKPDGGTRTGFVSSFTLSKFFWWGDPAELSQPGLYTLELIGNCGDKQCPCRIQFIIKDCSGKCDCEDLSTEVNAGFKETAPVTPPVFNCWKRTFTPLKLDDKCDKVTWTVNGRVVGSTNGNTPFTFTFPNDGIYNVCMTVVRLDSDGTRCKSRYCKRININCKDETGDGNGNGIANLRANNDRSTAVFPNPTTDQLTIRFEQATTKETMVEIVDTRGQLVRTLIVADGTVTKTFSMAELPPGMYVVRIRQMDQPLQHFRVVKQ